MGMSRAIPNEEPKLRTPAVGAPVRQSAVGPAGGIGWLGTLALVAVPVVCCGLPLLVAALIATGAGAWLAVHGYLLAIPSVALAAALLAARYVRGTRF